MSIGTNCLICNQTAGNYLNYGANICTACPAGSVSTGSSCTCANSNFWNTTTNMCVSGPNFLPKQFNATNIYRDFLFLQDL